jgi:hypothetical protein
MAKNNSNSIATPSTDIILKVIQEVKDLSRKDIKKWRDAMLIAADVVDPRWYLLQDLYDYLSTDGHLGAVADIRKAATLNHPFYIVDLNGEEMPEQTELLQKKWFYDFLENCLDAVFKKYSIMQFGRNADTVIFDLIPRRHVCIQNKRIYTEYSGSKYIDYTNESNVIEVIDRSEYGILNDIVPNLIWKKNLLQSNAEFSERFGFPLITAMTANKADASRIDKALKNLGEAGTGVLPKGSEIQVHALANAGNPEKVYLDPVKMHDNQVSKRFIGSTTIVDEGANRSQTTVHVGTLDDKLALKDRRLITFIINDQLFPVLQNLGFPFDNTKMKFKFDETESLTIEQEWKITNEALDHYELDTDDVQKKFRLKIKGLKQPSNTGLSANFQ